MKNTIFEKINEGTTELFVHINKEKTKGPGLKEKNIPFYNPSMELNRDLSILILEDLINENKKTIRVLDGLAASGIRGIRFANEIDKDFSIYINDWAKESYDLIRKNIKKNNLKNICASNKNLNVLLSEEKFDYIDIDPFGSPVYFFDSAIRSIKHNGIIAATSTDTAALCGVYPKVCIRRYDAIPFYCICMKELGIRILIASLARTAIRHDKGILPIISYVTDHYFRIYVKIFNSLTSVNETIKNIKFLDKNSQIGLDKTNKNIGPIWTGNIEFRKIFINLRDILNKKKLGTKNILWSFLDILEEESVAPMFYYTSDSLSKHFNKSTPKKKAIFEFLKENNYCVNNTHFDQVGFKTNANLNIIEKMFK